MDRRALILPREYLTHAKNIDRVYGEVQEGVVGPVQTKLESFPPLSSWDFGAWGEASKDVHTCMVDHLADARQKHQKLLQGMWRWERMEEEAEIACYKGQTERN